MTLSHSFMRKEMEKEFFVDLAGDDGSILVMDWRSNRDSCQPYFSNNRSPMASIEWISILSPSLGSAEIRRRSRVVNIAARGSEIVVSNTRATLCSRASKTPRCKAIMVCLLLSEPSIYAGTRNYFSTILRFYC